jgi:lipoyl-dependent peroxiredoxin
MKMLYRTEATSTGGREGTSRTADGALDVKLAQPQELGGRGGPGTNPEQLFAAGWSACFLSALRFVAGKSGIRLSPEAQVTARIGVGQRDDGAGYGLEATLVVRIPGLDRAIVAGLAEKAHGVCPYSHATRGNIPVTTETA